MIRFSKHIRGMICCVITALILAGCATYYQQNLVFQQYFSDGNLDEAAKVLDKNERAARGKSRLLYLLQKGVVLQMQGEYEESNRYFEEAYLFTEDVQKNFTEEALSIVTNPMVIPYKGEDFEVVLIHYYKALNYLRLRQFEEALVECRRINIELNELNDRYANRKNRYRRDAFALNLMGIIFEATGEINNAFISYRNAFEAYQEDYEPYFGVPPPLQLKKDLLRTAYLNGFSEELKFYENEFGMKYTPQQNEGGELVFFWKNGLGPVKSEWSINFAIVRGDAGFVTFVNDEMGMSFPFPLGGDDRQSSSSLGDLRVVRVAFPKYLEREPFYSNAELIVGNKRYSLETAENINAIAFSTLEDRMLREFGKSLLRLAVKQAAEQAVRSKNDNLGTLFSLVSAATEKADTRNWQTLPHSISYVRVPLEEGSNKLELKSYSSRNSTDSSLEFEENIKKGETVFNMYHTLESVPLPGEMISR